MMPERVAKTDPFERINEYVGSGPFKFLADQWVTGVQAIYERFDGYVPLQQPPSFLGGGKVGRGQGFMVGRQLGRRLRGHDPEPARSGPGSRPAVR